MEFISVEEFINQSKKVQEVFRDWCENNLEVNDYVVPINPETNEVADSICRINQCLDTRQHKVNVGRVFYLETCLLYDTVFEFVPLLTEGQLRKFIEDKKGLLDIEVQGNGKMFLYQYSINCFKSSDEGLFCGDSTHFEIESDNPLQAYWKVACEIAKESVEGGL